jgi:CBS domain containing-hemolysin-like protein
VSDGGDPSGWLALAAVLLLVIGNGLFVAVEFAVVSARGPGLDEAAATGDRRAKRVIDLLDRLPFFLSTVQFGITATSLVVGFLAERALGDTVIRPALTALGVAPEAGLAVAVTLALFLSTVFQMIFGELFPKNVAISRPLSVARALAGFAHASMWLLGPIVRIFDRAAETMTRVLFRVETPERLEDAPGLDELSRIIVASGARGSLTSAQTELLRRAVSLGARRVGEVMVPRPDVVWIESSARLSDVAELAARTGHSRFPVRAATEDEVVGTVHIKDQLAFVQEARGSVAIKDVMTPALFVPESETLRRLLGELRRRHRTFAVVVDEFGSTAGIVTLEDVLETLVGDIEDEFDPASRRSRGGPVGAGGKVPGAMTLARFTERFGIELPDGPYETVAGFLLSELGHIPGLGERVLTELLELTVLRRDGLRVTEIGVRLRSQVERGQP